MSKCEKENISTINRRTCQRTGHVHRSKQVSNSNVSCRNVLNAVITISDSSPECKRQRKIIHQSSSVGESSDISNWSADERDMSAATQRKTIRNRWRKVTRSNSTDDKNAAEDGKFIRTSFRKRSLTSSIVEQRKMRKTHQTISRLEENNSLSSMRLRRRVITSSTEDDSSSAVGLNTGSRGDTGSMKRNSIREKRQRKATHRSVRIDRSSSEESSNDNKMYTDSEDYTKDDCYVAATKLNKRNTAASNVQNQNPSAWLPKQGRKDINVNSIDESSSAVGLNTRSRVGSGSKKNKKVVSWKKKSKIVLSGSSTDEGSTEDNSCTEDDNFSAVVLNTRSGTGSSTIERNNIRQKRHRKVRYESLRIYRTSSAESSNDDKNYTEREESAEAVTNVNRNSRAISNEKNQSNSLHSQEQRLKDINENSADYRSCTDQESSLDNESLGAINLNNRCRASSRTTQNNIMKHDAEGSLIVGSLRKDICDCLDLSCTGCFPICFKCKGYKCGPSCRRNRNYIVKKLIDPSNGKSKLNPYIHIS